MYEMHQISFVQPLHTVALILSLINQVRVSSKVQMSQRHSRGGIYCTSFFSWKLGQKVRTMSVAQGNTDFSDATRVSSERCGESILP